MSQTLDSLVEVIGMQPAIELTRAFGGRIIYVPMTIETTHPITLTVGWNAAEQLAKHYGGSQLKVPAERNVLLQLRNECIVSRHTGPEKASINGLANEYGLDRAMIRKILRKAGVLTGPNGDQ